MKGSRSWRVVSCSSMNVVMTAGADWAQLPDAGLCLASPDQA